MKINWKVVSAIFIVISLLELAILIYWWNAGETYIKNEEKCFLEICGFTSAGDSIKEYEAYYYDSYYGLCYCYKNGEIAYQEKIS